MNDARGDAGEPSERLGSIEVTKQWGDASGTQLQHPLGRRGQCITTHARLEACGDAQAHVPATDDEDALAAKARRQCAERTLV